MKMQLVLVLAATVLSVRGEMVDLFNGKDFTGWGADGKTEMNGYIVKDGMIESTNKARNLMTDREFGSYVLEFEFQLTPGANNGLGIHYPGNGNPAYSGMELQILDGEHVVTPAPLDRHQRISLNLTRMLENFLYESRLGELREAPYGVHLSPHCVVEPDLVVILAAHLDRIGRRGGAVPGRHRSGHCEYGHQSGRPSNIEIVHNTIIASGNALDVRDISGPMT